MKNYIITVNGTSYEVAVEEVEAGSVSPAPAPVKKQPVAPAAKGSISVNAPMPGKILAVKVNIGTAVKKGDVILVLEAMKMENEIIAPEDGTVAGINVAIGDSVEVNTVLVTLN